MFNMTFSIILRTVFQPEFWSQMFVQYAEINF